MDRNRGFDISALRQQIEDLLEDFSLSGGGRRPQGGRGAGGDQPQHLALNIVDTEESIIVSAPLPGLTPDDIDISVRGQSLMVRAQQRTQPAERPQYSRREWGFGPYQRTVELGSPVDADQATASFRGGVVTITLPKADSARARVIQLQEETAPASEGEPQVQAPAPEPISEVVEAVPETVAEAAAPIAEPTEASAAPMETEASAEPKVEPAAEQPDLALTEEAPTRFYMRPPRRRGGQSRAARGNAKAAAEKAAAEKAASEKASTEAADKPAEAPEPAPAAPEPVED